MNLESGDTLHSSSSRIQLHLNMEVSVCKIVCGGIEDHLAVWLPGVLHFLYLLVAI